MTLKKWLYLFGTTLLIGGLTALITGTVMEATEQSLFTSGIINLLLGILGFFGAGMMFSVISQMGFFAYLWVHRFGLAVFRRPYLWLGIQIIVTVVVFIDFALVRQIYFGNNQSIWEYFLIPSLLFAWAVLVSLWKVKETNQKAFIPTLFFLFVVTIVEWVPALRENNIRSMIFMLIPLMACNTWQVMKLHHLVETETSEEMKESTGSKGRRKSRESAGVKTTIKKSDINSKRN
ncbi:KinB-signaling pathway activation protein [Microaerobacter geothermalis]|uniref:KinB-signaling pathway activation protein n=1 Tax=Microaerobacter geothermalis TaxID=674972 RepID=UPI001F172043|nr:KinB-signaling pathway activation protein [Microaerobacter geothermalis]MCF6095284.1 KinB-signaling pathway activation protein [Microaerobacter geothermalis]